MKLEYDIDQELPAAASEFIEDAIGRSFHVASVEFTPSRIAVHVQDEVSQEKFREVMRNLVYVSKSISRSVLYENRVSHSYNENPMQHLEATRDVVKTCDGMYSFQGMFWQVLKACKAYVLKVAEKYAAIEQEYPVLWPIDLYKKINYLKEFPHQVVLAAPLEDSYEVRDAFAAKYEKQQSYESVAVQDGLAASTYGLQCAVCDICYYNLRSTRDHQNTIYTTYNKVFRNERSKTESLDRLTTFSVRDIMFVGDKDFVLVVRQQMLDEAETLLSELDLDSKIETANDPFFSNDSVVKNLFQSTSELKHELLAKLNYSDSYVAVGSVNLHLDFFGEAFDIQLPDGSPVYSGCLGIGFERLAFVLYSQYGPQVDQWPAKVRAVLAL